MQKRVTEGEDEEKTPSQIGKSEKWFKVNKRETNKSVFVSLRRRYMYPHLRFNIFFITLPPASTDFVCSALCFDVASHARPGRTPKLAIQFPIYYGWDDMYNNNSGSDFVVLRFALCFGSGCARFDRCHRWLAMLTMMCSTHFLITFK